jgi:nucleoside phosphorylase
MLCIKTGMLPEKQIALAHAGADVIVLSGIQTVETLDKIVPGSCTGILSFGLCGGLRQTLPVVGQTLIASRLVGPNDEIYEPDRDWNHRLFLKTHAYTQCWYSNGTFNTSNTPTQRASIWRATFAWCVDDESLAVAQFARARGIKFTILRTVSDAWDDDVSITSNLLNSKGGVDVWQVIKAATSNPSTMIKIWRDYSTSVAELGTAAIQVGQSFQL